MADLGHLNLKPYARRPPAVVACVFNVLYVGRLAVDDGLALLAAAFLAARGRDQRLHLTVAGSGPDAEPLRALLGEAATFIGPLDHDKLAREIDRANLLLFAAEDDSFDHVVLEARLRGLPVLAVDAGRARELIAHGRSGLLVPPDADALARALLMVAHRPPLRTQLSRGGLAAARAVA